MVLKILKNNTVHNFDAEIDDLAVFDTPEQFATSMGFTLSQAYGEFFTVSYREAKQQMIVKEAGWPIAIYEIVQD